MKGWNIAHTILKYNLNIKVPFYISPKANNVIPSMCLSKFDSASRHDSIVGYLDPNDPPIQLKTLGTIFMR